MSDFQPIPGVWYVDRSYIDADLDIWYLYAPHRPGTDEATYPWWSNDTLEWEKEAPVDRLEVLHNPHPPTRTEWGARAVAQSGNVVFQAVGKTREEVERYVSHMNARYPSDGWRVAHHQVTETEWVEVDEKEGLQ